MTRVTWLHDPSPRNRRTHWCNRLQVHGQAGACEAAERSRSGGIVAEALTHKSNIGDWGIFVKDVDHHAAIVAGNGRRWWYNSSLALNLALPTRYAKTGSEPIFCGSGPNQWRRPRTRTLNFMLGPGVGSVLVSST